MSDESDYTPIASLHVAGTKEEWLAALNAQNEPADELDVLRELNAVMLEALRFCDAYTVTDYNAVADVKEAFAEIRRVSSAAIARSEQQPDPHQERNVNHGGKAELIGALAQAEAREAEWKAEKAKAHNELCLEPDECDLVTACRYAVENIREAKAALDTARAEADAMRKALQTTNMHLAKLVNGDGDDDEGEPVQAVWEAARQQVLTARAALRSGRPQGEERT